MHTSLCTFCVAAQMSLKIDGRELSKEEDGGSMGSGSYS